MIHTFHHLAAQYVHIVDHFFPREWRGIVHVVLLIVCGITAAKVIAVLVGGLVEWLAIGHYIGENGVIAVRDWLESTWQSAKAYLKKVRHNRQRAAIGALSDESFDRKIANARDDAEYSLRVSNILDNRARSIHIEFVSQYLWAKAKKREARSRAILIRVAKWQELRVEADAEKAETAHKHTRREFAQLLLEIRGNSTARAARALARLAELYRSMTWDDVFPPNVVPMIARDRLEKLFRLAAGNDNVEEATSAVRKAVDILLSLNVNLEAMAA